MEEHRQCKLNECPQGARLASLGSKEQALHRWLNGRYGVKLDIVSLAIQAATPLLLVCQEAWRKRHVLQVY
eukprot:3449947-Prorocentrum_lima.AAC.1